MKKISFLSFVLILTLCLPLFVACDFNWNNFNNNINDGNGEEKTTIEGVTTDVFETTTIFEETTQVPEESTDVGIDIENWYIFVDSFKYCENDYSDTIEINYAIANNRTGTALTDGSGSYREISARQICLSGGWLAVDGYDIENWACKVYAEDGTLLKTVSLTLHEAEQGVMSHVIQNMGYANGTVPYRISQNDAEVIDLGEYAGQTVTLIYGVDLVGTDYSFEMVKIHTVVPEKRINWHCSVDAFIADMDGNFGNNPDFDYSAIDTHITGTTRSTEGVTILDYRGTAYDTLSANYVWFTVGWIAVDGYDIANFACNVYDAEGSLLETVALGLTTPEEGVIYAVADYLKYSSATVPYRVKFDDASLVNLTQYEGQTVTLVYEVGLVGIEHTVDLIKIDVTVPENFHGKNTFDGKWFAQWDRIECANAEDFSDVVTFCSSTSQAAGNVPVGCEPTITARFIKFGGWAAVGGHDMEGISVKIYSVAGEVLETIELVLGATEGNRFYRGGDGVQDAVQPLGKNTVGYRIYTDILDLVAYENITVVIVCEAALVGSDEPVNLLAWTVTVPEISEAPEDVGEESTQPPEESEETVPIVDNEETSSSDCEQIWNNIVIEGRYQWLYYLGDNSMEYYKGTNLLTETELEYYNSILVELNEICKSNEITLQICIWPNKEQVYPEYYLGAEVVNEYKRVERLVDYIHENSDVKIIYPLAELTAAKPYWETYYKIDTHWNMAGGFIGYQAMLESLGLETTNLYELSVCEFDCKWGDLIALGDLNGAYYTGAVDYTISYKPEITVDSYYGGDGNNDIRHTTSANATNDCNFVMIGDSYRTFQLDLIQRDFSDAYLCHRAQVGDSMTVDAIKNADILVIAATERYDYDIFNTAIQIINILSQE